MKWMIASDIHGSEYYCNQLLEAYKREGADRLLLLGDILYHGQGTPSRRTGVSSQSSFSAARRSAYQSRRLSRQENAVGLSHSRSQKASFRAPHRFSTRSGKGASTRTRTCPRRRFTI